MKPILLLNSAAILILFCAGCGPEYWPITRYSPSDRLSYQCDIVRKGDSFSSTLTHKPNPAPQSLRLDGKAECLAVNERGDLIAMALTPTAGPNAYGHHYLANKIEIVFVDARSFQIVRRWSLNPPSLPPPERNGYVSPIHNIDEMAFSTDARIIATFYWGRTPAGRDGPILALWDVDSGREIRQIAVPLGPTGNAPESGMGAVGLAFSKDDRLVCLSGFWGRGKYAPPDTFMAFWQVSDGSMIAMKPMGHEFLRSLCFDKPGTHLACWTWAKGISMAEVRVLGVPEGNTLVTKRVRGRILGIIQDDSQGFKIALENGSWQPLPVPAEKIIRTLEVRCPRPCIACSAGGLPK